MKKLTLISFLLLSLTGCIQHIQVFDTATTNTRLSNDYFVYETDTLLIKYYFWAKNGILAFSVFNKLDKPIYIDWKNSSFVYNDDKLNYWNDEAFYYTAGIYKSHSYHGNLILPDFSVSEGVNVSTTLKVKPERITFIPPKSNYYNSTFRILPAIYDFTPYAMVHYKDSLARRSDKPKKKTILYVERFLKNGSPIRFRNFLAISLNENFQHVFYVDNEFYVSAITEMDIRHFHGKILGFEKDYIYTNPFKKNNSFFH
jgi:hypothetical protein